MAYLFNETIAGWDSWGRVFQSIPAFAPLVRHILDKHGLPQAGIRHLTPGTNAVFRVGELVVKVFAPVESGVGPEVTCGAELAGLRHAEAAGVPAPRVLAQGEVWDKYRFPYLVIEYLAGQEAGEVLPSLTPAQKNAFAQRLRAVTLRLNVPPGADIAAGVPFCLVENLAANPRWDPVPPALRREALALAEALPEDSMVFVHGDLTGENVLLGGTGGIALIDFGDCQLAPSFYEWLPLVFDLLGGDAALLDAYFGAGAWQTPAFAETLTRAVALHDFGGDFALRLCEETGTPPGAVTSLAALGALVARRLGIPPGGNQ